MLFMVSFSFGTHLLENGDRIYLVMPYADQSLDNYIYGKLHLEEREAKWIMYQVLTALDYLHKNNIGHGDIKPSNILLYKNTHYKPNQDPCMKWIVCVLLYIEGSSLDFVILDFLFWTPIWLILRELYK